MGVSTRPKQRLRRRKADGLGQQVGHLVCDPAQLRRGDFLPDHGSDTHRLRHRSRRRADGGHGIIRRQADQAAADIEAALAYDISAVKKHDIGGAAADIQIDHGAVMVHAVLKRAAPLAGNDRFQIRSRRGDHKLAGKSAELFRDQGRVFLAGRFSRNDHRAGVELRRGKPAARYSLSTILRTPSPSSREAVFSGVVWTGLL